MMFPITLRKKLAKGTARIEIIVDFTYKLTSANFTLEKSVLSEHAKKLVSIVKAAISSARSRVDTRENARLYKKSKTLYCLLPVRKLLERDNVTQSHPVMPGSTKSKKSKRDGKSKKCKKVDRRALGKQQTCAKPTNTKSKER